MISAVVVGVEPSGTAQLAFDYGRDIAEAFGAQVHLVMAFADGSRRGAAVSEERRRAEQVLDRFAQDVDPTGRRVTVHAMPLKVTDAILQVADEVGADLIVIGNKGVGGAGRVLGSIASVITNSAPCTVTVVKTS